MGFFDQETAEKRVVADIELKCEICKNDTFWFKKAQLNTAIASFFSLDWANPTAQCFVCEKCGYIHWFLI
ncbi:MAG: hypothetical protein CVV64_12565 [Candidatus Wallbacteria bacterium HGW-Wallbacteria-1]|uniref:DNA-binding protein n=1 Tax=Candidatus Wallbacteria bacterium HGW-Wallbacteria-1 TaxID=2013854 RepID=A0A2N1PNE7_9BACT|nr:MAG: hypothetical protein CVV64_12565 [Candidatus Wallbacteria bacterium HGW-Wallbacteria-1]